MTDPKLAGLIPEFKRKCAAVLADLAGKGWQIKIAEGRRTITQQRAKVKAGYSRTLHSKHLTGMAADIIDRRYGWDMTDTQKALWRKHIRSSCKAHGLTSGSVWTRTYGKWGDLHHIELP